MSNAWTGNGEVLHDDAVVAHVDFEFADETAQHPGRGGRSTGGRGSTWRGWLTITDGSVVPSGPGRSPELLLRGADGWYAPLTVERGEHASSHGGHRIRAHLMRAPEPPEGGDAAPVQEAEGASADGAPEAADASAETADA